MDRKKDRSIAAVTSRVRKSTHKCGIKISNFIKHAEEIDRLNKNTLWQDALKLEMTNVEVAFKILEDNEHVPPGYRKSSGHIIWDLKMDFTRKARWVKDGHRTPEPLNSTFAGVLSRESIRIALTYASLNGLPVWGADI